MIHRMTPLEYRTALHTLSLTPEQLERAAEAAYRAYGFTSPWTDEYRHSGAAQPDTKEVFRSVVRAVVASVNEESAK